MGIGKEKTMIELQSGRLVFSFLEVHPQATLRIDFLRTLRIPDDGKSYPLPPGLSRFPLQHVDDFLDAVPAAWKEHGGVMLPMYQAEALWLKFQSDNVEGRWTGYPFAVKVATGKINAVSGQPWSDGLHREPQDYLVAPGQPWLDGYCVKKGYIRQFVAMPLGAGYSAEEQLSGQAKHGGLQILVHPMKRDAFERYFPIVDEEEFESFEELDCEAYGDQEDSLCMALAPGGLMAQKIYVDRFKLDDWDISQRGRCFVHIVNSLVWRSLTGMNPPTPPPTAKEYTKAGLPWFDYYDEKLDALDGSAVLDNMQSVAARASKKGEVPLPENESVVPGVVVKLRAGLKKDQVREGQF
jgi:hypothetical protein